VKAADYQRTATEAQVQSAIVSALLWIGAEVEVTSERRHKCTKCGEYSHAGTGMTKGIGDLLVRNPAWPTAMKLNLEVKSATGKLSPEQQQSEERGGIVIVRSAEEAMEAYKRVEGVAGTSDRDGGKRMTDDPQRPPYDDARRREYQRLLCDKKLRRDQLRTLAMEIFFDLERVRTEKPRKCP
jgi:hypothetical protein